jgi:dipeptidyl aminopeptidase/acylaminoacyl peptidase
MAEDGKGVYFTGVGASPKGDHPFVMTVGLDNGKRTEVWRSAEKMYEMPFARVAGDTFVVRRESPTAPPNYFLADVKDGKWTQLTTFANPYGKIPLPERQVMHYKRKDGVELSADLYLPVGYKKSDGPLPTLIHAYPVEYKDKDAAGQVQGSEYLFPRYNFTTIPILFTTQGYAVMQNTAIPIVGTGKEEPNDTYVEQIVEGAQAAIDAGAKMGVVDPKRVAVMGHSYGAFMTANLLAHSNLFKAGISMSGAYNRSLTPFGFQREERVYWQDPKLYFDMSPFSFADKIKTPILMFHGQADDNQGTFPIQSDRFYAALKGNGATVRFVALPLEAHVYAGRESLETLMAETKAWLDEYVKGAK